MVSANLLIMLSNKCENSDRACFLQRKRFVQWPLLTSFFVIAGFERPGGAPVARR